MANEFMQAAKMAYGFSGTTQKILWFLCDEISATGREKYLKSRIGFIVRSYDLIAFRCACNRSSVSQAITTLTEARVLRAIKKGPHRYYLFCIYLDKLIALRKEWEQEKREMAIRKIGKGKPTREQIAEEERMWEAEGQEEEAGYIAEEQAMWAAEAHGEERWNRIIKTQVSGRC
jgi:hypothetical protein